MARKSTQRSSVSELQSMRSHLEKFDLSAFKKWLRQYKFALWQQFIKLTPNVQMSIMCKMICDRKDMLATEAHKKAVQWLKEHNTKGGIF